MGGPNDSQRSIGKRVSAAFSSRHCLLTRWFSQHESVLKYKTEKGRKTFPTQSTNTSNCIAYTRKSPRRMADPLSLQMGIERQNHDIDCIMFTALHSDTTPC